MKAWERTRDALIKIPALQKLDSTLPCTLDEDTSQKYTGDVLQQPASLTTVTITQASLSTMNLRPVAYISHKITPKQQRHSAQEREAWATFKLCNMETGLKVAKSKFGQITRAWPV